MTNSVHIGDQTVITNTDGSITVTMVTDTGITRGILPTPIGWLLITLLIVSVAFLLFKKKKKHQINRRSSFSICGILAGRF